VDLLEYYGRRAPEYERIFELPERQDDLRGLKRSVRSALEGRDVLEVACGTGYWTEAIAPVAQSILATDGSATVLEFAKRKRYPPGQVSFAVANAYRLEGISRRFSAGFAGFWWSHIPLEKFSDFLDLFHSRLSENAIVVACDNRYVEGSNTPSSRVDRYGNNYQRRQLEDGSRCEVLKNFLTADQLRSIVEGRGTAASITESKYYWCLTYRVASSASLSTPSSV
jgi:demethylmenaquinone methyltransferase/2-methoxy-6-polyprenyl-1,4-benzoquinol methylase